MSERKPSILRGMPAGEAAGESADAADVNTDEAPAIDASSATDVSSAEDTDEPSADEPSADEPSATEGTDESTPFEDHDESTPSEDNDKPLASEPRSDAQDDDSSEGSESTPSEGSEPTPSIESDESLPSIESDESSPSAESDESSPSAESDESSPSTESDESSPSADADDDADDRAAPAAARSARPTADRGRARRPTFYAAGFWRRLLAAAVDLAIVVPVALLMAWLAGSLADIHLPSSRHRGIDFWLDLILAGDPALVGIIVITVAIATVYVLVFQIALARTPGMRVLKLRIIDHYGDSPSTPRVAARTSGYLAAMATLGLGFVWIGFDSEKRGLHDWLAGTYVVKA